MKDPSRPNISKEQLEQEVQGIQDAIEGLSAEEAEPKLRQHQQLTIDRLRNQLSALRNLQKKPLADDLVMKAQLQAVLDDLPVDRTDLGENDSIWKAMVSIKDQSNALRSSTDLLLSELECKIKDDRKKFRKGTLEERKDLIDSLYAEFDEIVDGQSKVKKQFEQQYAQAKARYEQLEKEEDEA